MPITTVRVPNYNPSKYLYFVKGNNVIAKVRGTDGVRMTLRTSGSFVRKPGYMYYVKPLSPGAKTAAVHEVKMAKPFSKTNRPTKTATGPRKRKRKPSSTK